MKISDEGSFYTCMYSIVFKRGKDDLFGLIIGKKNDEKCHESMECTYIGESILPVRS